MFYSHEVLTSRKYGVATVWLVATLGSKSGLKKVSRKAILDVDVQKACEGIVTPAAPMALRLQSNLLYGVTRVYEQQCGYVLNDAEIARNNMRLLLKVMRESTLSVEGGNKGRAEQLILQDDPNFMPNLDLMPLDLDRVDLGLTTNDSTQRSTLSPHSSQLTGVGIGSQEDVGGIIIPQSASSFFGGPVGGFGSFSVRGNSGAGTRVEHSGLDDDLGLVIDDDGNLRLASELGRQPPRPLVRGEATDFERASAQARGQQAPLAPGTLGQPDDEGFLPLQDDDVFIPPQDDYPPAPGSDALPPLNGEQLQQQHITSEETAEAPIRRRPVKKLIPLDNATELRNGDVARWNADYVANMNEAIRHKNASKVTAIAKKNAEFWMFGVSDQGPLSIFSGAKLLEALTGVDWRTAGQKRPREEVDDSGSDRRVRSRGGPSSDEIGRGLQEDGDMPMMGDDTIEQGREAPTPLDDRHISSLMPWNQSTGSRRPTGLFSAGGVPTSASFGGAGPQLGSMTRRPSRLTSASPLLGRGIVGDNIEELQLPGSAGDVAMTGIDDFELFGPAAQVDTQTAEQSQWQRATLDGESGHFLEFVHTGIEELDQARDEAAMGEEEDEMLKGSIDFDTLLPPESHSRIVAAQALLHVLTLGTKSMLDVEQVEPFGAITMRLPLAL